MAFPAGGKLLFAPYKIKPGSAVRRSEMESGPPKQAKSKSRVMVVRSIEYYYTKAEKEAFETWFRGAECNWGASFFDWTDPETGVAISVRIVNGEYQASPENQGENVPINWKISFTFENWQG